jgi:hypothetical protein
MRGRRGAVCTALACALLQAAAAAAPALDVVEGLFSWYAPGGWDADAGEWADASGKGRTGVASAIDGSSVPHLLAAGTEPAGRGASLPVPFAAGSAGSTLRFGSDPIPANFSVCAVTRFPAPAGDAALLPPDAGGFRSRVLGSTAGAWTHGHERGLAGVVGAQR